MSDYITEDYNYKNMLTEGKSIRVSGLKTVGDFWKLVTKNGKPNNDYFVMTDTGKILNFDYQEMLEFVNFSRHKYTVFLTDKSGVEDEIKVKNIIELEVT